MHQRMTPRKHSALEDFLYDPDRRPAPVAAALPSVANESQWMLPGQSQASRRPCCCGEGLLPAFWCLHCAGARLGRLRSLEAQLASA